MEGAAAALAGAHQGAAPGPAGPGRGAGVHREVRPAHVRALLSAADFRNYWTGSAALALGVGGFLLSTAVSARSLTDSPFLVSLVPVAYFLPLLVGALPSGVLADAVDRRRIVIVSRSVSAAVAGLLTVLTALDRLDYVSLLVLSALTGATVVSEIAARNAYVAQVVRPEQVVSALALGSVQGACARVLAPLLVGWLIVTSGDWAGYLFFAVANLVCAAAFVRIRASGTPARRGQAPLSELADGLRYVRHNPDALAVVTVGVLTGVVGWVFLALLPLVVTDVLHAGTLTLAALTAIVGLGAAPPSLLLAVRGSRPGHDAAAFFLTTLMWGVGVVLYGLAHRVAFAAVALAVAGAGLGLQQIFMRTVLLRICDAAYHGRLMGVLMLTVGANVVGIFAAGALAEIIGVSRVIVLSGSVIVLVPLVVLFLRPRSWRA